MNLKLKQLVFVGCVLFVSQLWGQTAVGGCSSVSLTSVSSYEPNLVVAGGFSCQQCSGQCFDIVSQPTIGTTRNWLEQRQPNGTWVTVQGGTSGILGDAVSFSVSTPGVYRIRNQVPSRITTPSCPNGRDVRLINNQVIGKRGHYVATPTYTNEVFVGPVLSNQVNYTFVDGSGGNSAQSGFDFGEQVRINTTGSQNYTSWWVAIFENDGPMRYASNGWTNGQIDNNLIDLSAIWKSNVGSNANFESLRSYTVQFALANSCNTVWTNLDKTFFICPFGSGCREGRGDEKPISMSPNPASGYFSIHNLPEGPSTIQLYDLTGRLAKSYRDSDGGFLDIFDLDNGMYLVSVIHEGKQVYRSKLSVVK